MIEARGYEDLAYLVMRQDLQNNPGRFYSAQDIVLLAAPLEIDIRIATKWDVGSEPFRRCLASCLRRAAAIEDEANEGLVCLFASESRASAGPWTLVTPARYGEDYFSFRNRVRGTGSRPTSGVRGSRGARSAAEQNDWAMGPLRGKISAGDPAGHPDLDILLFDRGALYCDKGTRPHRLDGPSVFDWDNSSMYFTQHGEKHRLDGPAFLTPEREDTYYINNQELGDAGLLYGATGSGGDAEDEGDADEEPLGSRVMRSLISAFEICTGGKMSMDQRMALKKGIYRDYKAYEPEMQRLRAYFDDMMTDASA